MSELISTKEIVERAILVGVSTSDLEDVNNSLDELEELLNTAGADCVGRIVQNREKAHPSTYLGKGKVEELKELIWELDANSIVCDDELSPAQLKNLENLLQIKIMDRTMVILDIFAKRATTSEGKIQVELAQLKYSSIRLAGLYASMSRLGGGIGTRGPGEKKIELDRRLIHNRISQLKAELADMKKHRQLSRKSREKSGVFKIAIVGYTNAGKSTLLNKLTNSDILAEDKLFATLDPTTRKLELESGQSVLITDTVGFINKLPHHLIEAFKSTLEEAKYADLILHVVDISNKMSDTQILVVYDTLKQLEVMGKEIVTVYNKIDKVADATGFPRDFHANYMINISAATGYGLEDLKLLIEKIIRSRKIFMDKVFEYNRAGQIQEIRKYGELLSEEYTEEGIHIQAFVPIEIFERLKK